MFTENMGENLIENSSRRWTASVTNQRFPSCRLFSVANLLWNAL